MPRRIHVKTPLAADTTVELDPAQAHHLRDVLRLTSGDSVEAFDDAGTVALALIGRCDADHVELQIGAIQPPAERLPGIIIAAAVPKGDRAEWMVEKLSELGVSRFIPLAAKRSVVLPAGQNKLDRWERIATEAARQSRRRGTMRIDPLTELSAAVALLSTPHGTDPSDNLAPPGPVIRSFHLSTESAATPIARLVELVDRSQTCGFFIGPEGGWTDDELQRFYASGLTGLKLTGTILRVETAAVATAAIAASLLG